MKYKNLNLKYAVINAFYFLLLCGNLGYANNFLQYKGFDTGVIGIILTCISILALIGQTGMAPIIDRSKVWNEKKFILTTLLVTVIMDSLLLFIPNGSPLVIVCVIIGFSFASMGVPYLNSIAFIYEKEGQVINYGLGRGVGSCAYAVAGLAVGQLIRWRDPSVIPMWLIVMAAATMAMVWTLHVPEKKVEAHVEEETKKVSYVAFFKKYRDILLVIVSLVCLYFCHMLINNYMLDVVTAIGGDAGNQGTATFIQAMVELPPMFAFALIMKKFKVDHLLLVASVFWSLKHILILIAPNITVYYAAMVLQMVSYALIVPSGVYFADEHIDAEERNQGQVIFAATATIGGLFASLVGGILIKAIGIPATLKIGTVVSVIGTLLMVYALRKLKK